MRGAGLPSFFLIGKALNTRGPLHLQVRYQPGFKTHGLAAVGKLLFPSHIIVYATLTEGSSFISVQG